MIYYLSGPMAGYPENNFPAFQKAQIELGFLGYPVVSPHAIDHGDTTEWADFLRGDIKVMLDCAGLILLKGWPQSRGSRLELSIALALDWPVFYYHDNVLTEMNK